jgi:UDPglucose 6-dehydrogenase/GDP-mannose 6-dehydrogenase
MKIAIIGTGYVGLVTGACFAEVGYQVVCVDVDEEKISTINSGQSPIHEDGLEEMLSRHVSAGSLVGTTNLKDAIISAEVIIIAVGTPFDGQEIDLTFIRGAAREIGEVLRGASRYHVVCVKSTVVPGTTAMVVGSIIEEASGLKVSDDFGLAVNPEFLAEGTAVRDFMEPDRIVVGASDPRTVEVMQRLYLPFEGIDMIITNPTTAEMIKYASNSFLATVISFSNEIANLCAATPGIDIVNVLEGVHTDKRLSPLLPQGRIRPGLMAFLFPGTGFGGSCFPKDVKALAAYGGKIGKPTRILNAVLETNLAQPQVTVDLLINELGPLGDKQITVLGLAFKPGTDDVRESPAVTIINHLLKSGARVIAHDPIAIDSMKHVLVHKQLKYIDDLEQAISSAEAVVLVTSWPEYKSLHELLGDKEVPIVDGRRFLDKNKYMMYRGIGLSN